VVVESRKFSARKRFFIGGGWNVDGLSLL